MKNKRKFKNKYLLVDANNLLCRAHYASGLTNKKGEKVSGTFGTMKMMKNLLEKFQPETTIVAWDEGKSKQRIAIYPEYKAQREKNRKPQDVEDLHRQRVQIQKIFDWLPVIQLKVQDVEADDIIGILCEKLKGSKVIVSNDTDFVQCVTKETKLYLPNKKEILTPETVNDHLGFDVKYYVLWKSMVGDTSDNIKGIKGIGPVKATKIILAKDKMKKKLPINPQEKQILDRNKYLIAIGALLQPKQIKKIRFEYMKEKKKRPDWDLVKREFMKCGFKSLVYRYHEWSYNFRRLQKRGQ